MEGRLLPVDYAHYLHGEVCVEESDSTSCPRSSTTLAGTVGVASLCLMVPLLMYLHGGSTPESSLHITAASHVVPAPVAVHRAAPILTSARSVPVAVGRRSYNLPATHTRLNTAVQGTSRANDEAPVPVSSPLRLDSLPHAVLLALGASVFFLAAGVQFIRRGYTVTEPQWSMLAAKAETEEGEPAPKPKPKAKPRGRPSKAALAAAAAAAANGEDPEWPQPAPKGRPPGRPKKVVSEDDDETPAKPKPKAKPRGRPKKAGAPEPDAEATDGAEEAPPKPKAKAKAKAKPKGRPKAKPAAAPEDGEAAPKPKPKPRGRPKAKPAAITAEEESDKPAPKPKPRGRPRLTAKQESTHPWMDDPELEMDEEDGVKAAPKDGVLAWGDILDDMPLDEVIDGGAAPDGEMLSWRALTAKPRPSKGPAEEDLVEAAPTKRRSKPKAAARSTRSPYPLDDSPNPNPHGKVLLLREQRGGVLEEEDLVQDLLRSKGYDPVVVPVVDYEPLYPFALPQTLFNDHGAAFGLVLTSPHAIQSVRWACSQFFGGVLALALARAQQSCPVFAVGREACDELRALGFEDVFGDELSDPTELPPLVGSTCNERNLGRATVLGAVGKHGDEMLSDLHKEGLHYDYIECFECLDHGLSEDSIHMLINMGPLSANEWIALYSPTSVDAFKKLKDALPVTSTLKKICIGQATQEYLEQDIHEMSDAVAATEEPDSLVASLVTYDSVFG